MCERTHQQGKPVVPSLAGIAADSDDVADDVAGGVSAGGFVDAVGVAIVVAFSLDLASSSPPRVTHTHAFEHQESASR